MRKGFLKRGLTWMLAFAMALPAGGYFSKSIDTVSAEENVKIGDIQSWINEETGETETDSVPEDYRWPSFYTSATPSETSYIYNRCRDFDEDGNPWWDRYITVDYGADRVAYLIYRSDEGNAYDFVPEGETDSEGNFKYEIKEDNDNKWVEAQGFYVDEWEDDAPVGATQLKEKYPEATYEDLTKAESNLHVWKVTIPGDIDDEDIGIKAGMSHSYTNENDEETVEYTEAYLNFNMPQTGLTIAWSDWGTTDEEGNLNDWSSKDFELWVNQYDDNFKLIQTSANGEKHLYTGSSVSVSYEGGAAETVDVSNGEMTYAFKKIGTYTVKAGNGTDQIVKVNAIPRPIDFYESTDFSSLFYGNIRHINNDNLSQNVYFYVNQEIWEGDDDNRVYYGLSEESPYTLVIHGDNDIEITNYEDMGDYLQIAPVEGKDGWYKVQINPTINCERLSLTVQVNAGDREESEDLNVEVAEAGSYAFVVTSGDVGNDNDMNKPVTWVNFDTRTDIVFYVVSLELDETTGQINPVKVTDINAETLHIQYDMDDENGEWHTHDAREEGLVSYDVKDGIVTAHFNAEADYDIVISEGENSKYVGTLNPAQAGFGFYTSDLRPEGYEIIEYLEDGAISYKEKQAKENSFSAFAWVWNEHPQYDWESALGEALEEGEESPFTGTLTNEQAISYFDFEKKTDKLSEWWRNFCMMSDMDTFTIKAVTDDGADVTKKYLTVTPVKANGFLQGEKIVISSDVKESFTIIATVQNHATLIEEQMKEDDSEWTWPEDDLDMSWAVGDPAEIKYSVDYTPFTGIKVSKAPTKTSYTEGDKIDVTGLQVSGVYKDGSTYALKADDYTVAPSAALTTADKKVTITYKDNSKLTASYDITVAAKAADKPATTEAPATTPTPSEVGATVTDTTADGTPSTATYTVTDKSTGATDAGEVTYSGETTGSEAAAVTIPDTIKGSDGVTYEVTKIADNALKGNKTVKEVTVGDNIKEVGAGAFQNATSLTTVKLGKNVEKLGNNAFAGCTSLKKVTASGSAITSIGDGAFKGDKALTSVDLSKSQIKTIGKNAFNGDKKLKTIKVNGNKLTKVGKGAFKGIKSKATITVYAKSKKVYNKVVKLIKKSGAKKVKYKFKKKK